MRKPLRIAAVVLSLLLALLGFAVWRMVRRGFSAHDEPGLLEIWAARTARRWAVPADLQDAKNPVAPTPEILASARAHWADHCAVCHGNDGKGQTAIGRGLYPKVPDMSLHATQSLSDGELFSVIENGIRLTGMPGWGDGTAESARGSWELVHLVRHFPEITQEELDEMAKLNPKSRAELEEEMEEERFLEGGASEAKAPAPGRAPSTPAQQHKH